MSVSQLGVYWPIRAGLVLRNPPPLSALVGWLIELEHGSKVWGGGGQFQQVGNLAIAS